MSYNAKVFNIMIASPEDVACERSIFRDVVYEWNAVNSEARNIVLLPGGWESHSSPEMGISPQEIINNQILGRCDILVGVFWTRIGTQTTKYVSGTVEEVEEHVQSGKPVMLYFSNQAVRMDTVDKKQIQDLNKFKESCERRSLYASYDKPADFKEKFYRHLQLKLNEHPLFEGTTHESISKRVNSITKPPELTKEARTLLKEASLDLSGIISYSSYLGGTSIQTNGKNLIGSNEPREIARWEAALEELRNEKLIAGRGNKNQIFNVTDLGYKFADKIELQAP